MSKAAKGITYKLVGFMPDSLAALRAESERTGEAVNSIIRRACMSFLEQQEDRTRRPVLVDNRVQGVGLSPRTLGSSAVLYTAGTVGPAHDRGGGTST